MIKKRSLIWDNYKGILIFLVVFSHFLYAHAFSYPSTYINKIVTFVYLFHMPAFIFCSGYFSVSDNAKSKKSIVKLVLYYLIFNTLMMIFAYFYSGKQFMFFTPYNSYWYLLSLIFWRLSIKYLDKIKGIVPISIIIALLMGYNIGFSNVLSIRRTIAFFPFFLIGYKLAKEGVLLKLNETINKKKIYKIIIPIVLIIFSAIVYLIISKYRITNAMLLMGAYKAYKHVIHRTFIFVVAIIFMLLILAICPNKYVPLLTKAGKNSLGIYVLHRFFTLEFIKIFPTTSYSNMLILYSFIGTIILTIVLSSEKLNGFINKTVSNISNELVEGSKKGKKIEVIILIIIIILLLFRPTTNYINKRIINHTSSDKNLGLNIKDTNYLTSDVKKKLDSAIKISYVGDLILLKDQVTSAYNSKTGEYEFDDIFEYTKKYFDDSDLSIGVFEGPTAGDSVSYSTSNFADGVKMYLNFPDSFAKAVKNSGIDLVTTANNHLLDRGYDGAFRTLDVLDKYGIKHSGSYKNQKDKDKNKVLIVNVNGVKIAVLSYLSSINYYDLDEVYKTHPYVTSIIPRTTSKNYKKIYNEIREDFKEAKDSDADLILVMAHMGTQFKHTTNNFQNKWNKVFSSLGADIILGDHAHAVQPIEYINDTVVVNCPGNFANSYIKYDGDATAITNIYIDKKDKKVIGTDVIPMYTQEVRDNYFRALPIYDIMTNKSLYESMSKYELHRIEEVSKLTTKVMINREISLKNAQKRYYYINNNYYVETDFTDIIKKYENKKLYKLIAKSNKICFIGDSVTHGTYSNHHPYYEPLMDSISGKKVVNISRGSYTTKLVLKKFRKQILLSNADTYVIALGTNDVRYRNKKICAMTSADYINQMKKIVKVIKKSNPKASIVFIAPWLSLSDDSISHLNYTDKVKMNNEYSDALEKYSKENNYLYINPNDYIADYLEKDRYKYMIDFIHPNESDGLKLYSEAILHESE